MIEMCTGFRIRFCNPELHHNEWERLRQSMLRIAPVLELAKLDRYFIDDALRDLSFEDALRFVLEDGEVFISQQDDSPVLLASVTNIFHRRHAYLNIWVHPDARTESRQSAILEACSEILNYAFKPWNLDFTGLGLNKLKAEIASPDTFTLKLFAKLGFQLTGYSPVDALYQGCLIDNVVVELLNPFLVTTPSKKGS